MGWTAPCCTGSNGLNWIALESVNSDWIRLDWNKMDFTGLDSIGLDIGRNRIG